MSKNKKRCHECMFRGDGNDLVGCDYATITGHVRGAIPPEECTHFRKGERMTKAEYKLLQDALMGRTEKKQRAPGGGRDEKYDWSVAEKMHAEGKNDGDIARVMGVRRTLVLAWRKRNGLKANTTMGGQKKELDWAKVREMYDQGKFDNEIAEAFGVCDNVIFKWRKRNNLPAVPPKGRGAKYDWDTVKQLYEAGLRDAQIEEKTGIDRKRIRTWRSQNHLPKNADPVNQDAVKFHERAKALHGQGLNDQQIAREMGVSDGRVLRWRHKHGLQPNATRERRKGKDKT